MPLFSQIYVKLAWLSQRACSVLGKRTTYYTLPVFSYTGQTWLGASRVAAVINYAVGHNFVMSTLPTKPGGANFVPCIKWRIGTTVYRYKLWDDEDCVLYAPLYDGEKIGANFQIELWTISSSTTVSLTTAINITTSIRQQPSEVQTLTAAALADGVASSDIYADQFDDSLPSLSGINSELWVSNLGLTQAGSAFTSWVGRIQGHQMNVNSGTVSVAASAWGSFKGVVTTTGTIARTGPTFSNNSDLYLVIALKKGSANTVLAYIQSAAVQIFNALATPAVSGANTITPATRINFCNTGDVDFVVFSNLNSVPSSSVRRGVWEDTTTAAAVANDGVSYIGSSNSPILAIGVTDDTAVLASMIEYINKTFKFRLPLPLVYSAEVAGTTN